jgi:T5orf172 domain
MVDIVYILTNEAMPGLIKIGCTNGESASRIKQLYSTGVPLPFELFYACEVTNCVSVESKLHDAFGDHRLSKGREFFRIAPERAKAALSLAEIREVKLGDEILKPMKSRPRWKQPSDEADSASQPGKPAKVLNAYRPRHFCQRRRSDRQRLCGELGAAGRQRDRFHHHGADNCRQVA